jgi:hypothetical protein
MPLVVVVVLVGPTTVTVTFTTEVLVRGMGMAGLTAVIVDLSTTLKITACPANLTVAPTAIAPNRLVPVILTEVPPALGPWFGESAVTVGIPGMTELDRSEAGPAPAASAVTVKVYGLLVPLVSPVTMVLVTFRTFVVVAPGYVVTM